MGGFDATTTCRSLSKAALVCAALFLILYGYARVGSRAGFTGTPLVARSAPPLALQTDSDSTFTLSSLRGRVILVYFGYTQCPDVCPTTLASLGPVFARLGSAAADVSVLFVTLDPQHDSPARLHAYLGAFSPIPVGLTGTTQQIAQAARAWGISWRHADGGQFIDHTSVITLVDPRGRMRVQYGYAQLSDPAGMARDIARVLHEPSGQRE
jgi:protein SCO1